MERNRRAERARVVGGGLGLSEAGGLATMKGWEKGEGRKCVRVFARESERGGKRNERGRLREGKGHKEFIGEKERAGEREDGGLSRWRKSVACRGRKRKRLGKKGKKEEKKLFNII